MKFTRRASLKNHAGFSLLEMLIGVVLMMIVCGFAFQATNYYQKSWTSTTQKVDMHRDVRSALELMTQEVGQAGQLTFAQKALGAAVVANATAQAVNVSPTT